MGLLVATTGTLVIVLRFWVARGRLAHLVGLKQRRGGGNNAPVLRL